MRRRWVDIAGFCALAAVAVAMTARYGLLGDYEADAGPAFELLAAGRVHDFLTANALMGPFALLARVPAVLLAGLGGASMLDRYQWGAVACLLAAAVLGVVLARAMRRADQSRHACAIAALLLVANPLVVKALQFGHPEEVLGAALCAGAMIAALGRKAVLAGVLFALALTTKQWAFVIVGPMVLAVLVYGLPRWRFAVALVATGLAVTAPSFVADPAGYVSEQQRAGTIPVSSWQPASPYSIWYPGTPAKDVTIRPVDGDSVVRVRPVPPFVAGIAKQLIVIAALLLSIPLLLRYRRLTTTDPLLFLAFVLLLRCVLDPFDNPYYHLPFLCAFLVWEGLQVRGVPLVSIFVSGAFLLQTRLAEAFTVVPDYTTHCAVYLAWALPLLAFMAMHLYSPALGRRVQERVRRSLPSLSRVHAAPATG